MISKAANGAGLFSKQEIKFTEPKIVPQDELREDELPPAADAIPDDVLLGNETKEGLSRRHG